MGKQAKILGFCMGFKTREIFFIVVVLLFIVTFLGNILHIGSAVPWQSKLLFGLISLNQRYTSPTKIHPILPLPNCSLVNATILESALMQHVNDDSLHQNVTNIPKIKKLFLDNEESFSRANNRLVSGHWHSSIASIHAIFRDILLTRAIENSYRAAVMKDILPGVKGQLDEHRHQKMKPGLMGSAGTISAPLSLDRYESCAIVGNSGVLWKSSRGSEIDDHEFVMRLNNAKPRGGNQTLYKQHIGEKTTMVFLNSHVLQLCLKKKSVCTCHPYGAEVPIMVYLCIPEHAVSVACCSFEHPDSLLLTDGRFDAFVSRIGVWYSLKRFLERGNGTFREWEKAHHHEFHYSSGFQAVIVALAICDKVDLYGFGKHPTAQHHFHSNQKQEHYAHDFEGEYLFYQDLEANRMYENPFLCQAGIGIPKVQIFH